MKLKLKLGVNIDHVATLRQARGTVYPDPASIIPLCRSGGADSITIHLREDRRHIQDRDLEVIAGERLLPLNLEMAAADEMVQLACLHKPEEVCLVPERRQELTTEGGLNAAASVETLKKQTALLAKAGIVVSLFIDPDPDQVAAAAEIGAPVIELHTGTYCNLSGKGRQSELDRLAAASRQAHDLGLTVNAGHGITLDNLGGILEIPHLDTLNIGHSIVAEAINFGMEEAVRRMKKAMSVYSGGRKEDRA